MPKKLDYQEELTSLKWLPDNTLRPVTTRVPVVCLRVLYQVCARDALDLSSLVRLILEEQADGYLASGKGRHGFGQRTAGPGAGASVTLQLPAEVKELVEKACAGLALDAPVLLQLLIAEALPAWVLKANRARQQRQQTIARLEGRLSPERAAWETYCQCAPAAYSASFTQLGDLIEEGAIRLEIDGNAVLRLALAPGAGWEGEGSVDHPGRKALQELTEAGVLAPDGPEEGSGGRWRLEPQALLRTAEPKSAPPSSERSNRRTILVDTNLDVGVPSNKDTEAGANCGSAEAGDQQRSADTSPRPG